MRNLDTLTALAKSEDREMNAEEKTEALNTEANKLRLTSLSEGLVRIRNNPNYSSSEDDRIDLRYDRTSKIPLVCNVCGAVFSTKNIEGIGRRSIFPFFGRGKHEYSYITLSEMCDSKGHKLSDLRLATDDEVEYLKGETDVIPQNNKEE